MIRSGEEILSDIDATLEQLIQNARVLKSIHTETLFAEEVTALQKTQESLLARLVHMQDLLATPTPKKQKESCEGIEHKIARFGRLNMELVRGMEKNLKALRKASSSFPVIRKNRKKSPQPIKKVRSR